MTAFPRPGPLPSTVPPIKRRRAWRIFFAWLKYLLWQIFSKVILGIICVAVTSEGLRTLVPALGKKIHTFPGLGAFKDFEETYKLDFAPFFALFLLVTVWALWSRILQVWLRTESEPGWHSERHRKIITTLGVTVLGADAALFFIAITYMGWGASFSVSALLSTAAYVAVIIFVSYQSLTLYKSISDLEKE